MNDSAKSLLRFHAAQNRELLLKDLAAHPDCASQIVTAILSELDKLAGSGATGRKMKSAARSIRKRPDQAAKFLLAELGLN